MYLVVLEFIKSLHIVLLLLVAYISQIKIFPGPKKKFIEVISTKEMNLLPSSLPLPIVVSLWMTRTILQSGLLKSTPVPHTKGFTTATEVSKSATVFD